MSGARIDRRAGADHRSARENEETISLLACSTTYPNQKPLNTAFPEVTGKSLEDSTYQIPQDFSGQPVLFLIGYKQKSQFDIDRWLIGLDMKGATLSTYELPTIQGLFPRMFQTRIDEGMRKGIPKALWKGVITIYKDGEKVQKFTGNTNPNNTRVVLLDSAGKIRYFNDEGFSVKGLNEVLDQYENLVTEKP